MATEVKRVRYFTGQFLHQADFVAEQDYHIQHLLDHQRLLHTPGIAEGFDVTPGTGTTSVAIQAGVGYDDLGQRIARAGNVELDLTGTLNSAGVEATDVYITVSWQQQASDPTTEPGGTGDTRYTEQARIDKSATPPVNNRRQLVLARVTRSGTSVGTIDKSMQLRSGVVVGDLEVPSVTLSRSDIARADWVKLNLAGAQQAKLAGSLDVTKDITANGRNVTLELDALKAHATDTSNPHQTTAAQIDTQGGTNQIVTRINAGTGVINAARVDTAIARASDLATHIANTANPHATTAAQVDTQGGANRIVTQINAGTGLINAVRVQFMPEKLNGEFHGGSLTLPSTGQQSILVTPRDLRGRVVAIRGWVSSSPDMTPAFYTAAAAATSWNPQAPSASVASREAWAYCKPSAASGAVTVFTLVDGGANISVLLDFTTTTMNLRFAGPVGHSFGYVFQFTWQE